VSGCSARVVQPRRAWAPRRGAEVLLRVYLCATDGVRGALAISMAESSSRAPRQAASAFKKVMAWGPAGSSRWQTGFATRYSDATLTTPPPAAAEPASPWPRRLAVATALVVGGGVLLHGAVLAVRGASVFSLWRDAVGEGAEGPHVFALWRVLHGLPLYGSALSAPFVRVPGNAAFYEVWAGGLHLLGVDGERILLWARVLTFASAVGGAVAWAALLRAFAGAEARGGRLLALGLGLVVWLGGHFVGWWALSIRPELPALACATLGLWLAVEAVKRESPAWMAGAGAAFALAWGMSSSTWALAAGVFAWLVLGRKWKLLAAWAGPVAVVVGGAWLAGSPDWRFQQFTAPSLGGVDPERAHYVFERVLPVCLPAWAVAVGVLWMEARRREREAAVARMLGCAVLSSALLAAVLVQRTGANREALFELYVVLAVLAARPLVAGSSTWLRAAALAGIGAWVAVAPLQLAYPGRFGVMQLEGSWRAGVRAWMQARAAAGGGTVLVLDDVLAQPWNASGGRMPAYVLDVDWLVHAAGAALPQLLRDVAGQPGVDAVVGDSESVQFIRGDSNGCRPLPASTGVPSWLECPPP
jgi:hypothetical protein